MVNIKQREFQMDPMQLLYYQAPLSAVMLFFIVPFLEPIEQTFTRSWSLLDIVMSKNIVHWICKGIELDN